MDRQPAGVESPDYAGVDPGVVGSAGAAGPGCGRAELWGSIADLSGARRGGRSLGALANQPRCRPGWVCGLLLSRSAEAIVAILAVLKTGAEYADRSRAARGAVEFMVADAAPSSLYDSGLAERFDACELAVIDLNDPASDQPGTALPLPASDDIAHVIYTSGTTGVPKVLPSPTITSPSCPTRLAPVCSVVVRSRSAFDRPGLPGNRRQRRGVPRHSVGHDALLPDVSQRPAHREPAGAGGAGRNDGLRMAVVAPDEET